MRYKIHVRMYLLKVAWHTPHDGTLSVGVLRLNSHFKKGFKNNVTLCYDVILCLL